MRFKLHGADEEVVGRSYSAIVASMADAKLGEVSSIKRYRERTAQRAQESFGKSIDATSDETFVKSLVAAGLAERTD